MTLIFDNSVSDAIPTGRTSFSGSDIKAIIYRPPYLSEHTSKEDGSLPGSGGLYHELGAIQTISISHFRDKREVRSLGFQNVMGYTRGGTTIAGSLIFALLDTHPFNDTGSDTLSNGESTNNGVLRGSSGSISRNNAEELGFIGERRHQYDFSWDAQTFGNLMYPHNLPPFDIIITFVNEAGATGIVKLYGVDLHHEGMTMSIEDLYTEVTYSYTARGYSAFEEGRYNGRLWTGSPLPFRDDYALGVLGSR